LTTSTPSSRGVEAGAEGAARLAERLGHTFGDLGLLRHALAHRSWCGEQEGGAPSNERLEFLGDAVLGLVVAGFTYARLRLESYTPKQLTAWRNRFDAWLAQGNDVYAYCKHEDAGKAPAYARQLLGKAN